VEVSMKKCSFGVSLALAFFLITSSSYAQLQEEGWRMTFRPTIGFEYFQRSMNLFTYDTEEKKWIEDDTGTELKAYFITFSLGLELQEGFSLTPILGYCVSDHGAITYRRLPFSVELDVGGLSGILFGLETEKRLLTYGNIDIIVFGQFFYYSGNKKEWDIPGLDVGGTIEGKPYWLRGAIGPAFAYRGYESFSPYLRVSYNRLWGKFKLEQKIEDLEKDEEKKLIGKSQINISLGAVYELTDAFQVQGEVGLMPHRDGVDFGLMLKAVYFF
jgi:hypothetical protein